MRQLTENELTTVFGAGIDWSTPLVPTDFEKTIILNVSVVSSFVGMALALECLPLSVITAAAGATFGFMAGVVLGDAAVRLNRYTD